MHRLLLIPNIAFLLCCIFFDINKWILFLLILFINILNSIIIVFDLQIKYPNILFDDSNFETSCYMIFFRILFLISSIILFLVYLFLIYVYIYTNEDYYSLLRFLISMISIVSSLFCICFFYYFGFSDYSGAAYYEIIKHNNAENYKECFLPSSLSKKVFELYKKNPVIQDHSNNS